MSYYCYYCY